MSKKKNWLSRVWNHIPADHRPEYVRLRDRQVKRDAEAVSKFFKKSKKKISNFFSF